MLLPAGQAARERRVSSDVIRLTLTRYRPEEDASLREDTYELPYQESTTVLEALRRIHSDQDDTLAFRWSCAQGKCGTCTVVLNGRPVLACLTLLRPGPARVEPPRRGAILRDLSTDSP